MQKQVLFWGLLFLFISCKEKEISSTNPTKWDKHRINFVMKDTLQSGKTYLPIYSHIYSHTEKKIIDLSATVSIRNINMNDTVFIDRADYFNTSGVKVRSYLNEPVYVKPMETLEIVIDLSDQTGGSGANFVFDWRIKKQTYKPYFEAIMISTLGQQGISFTTRGIHKVDVDKTSNKMSN